jgi:hypothetical protein
MDGILRKWDLPAVMATQEMGEFGPTRKNCNGKFDDWRAKIRSQW